MIKIHMLNFKKGRPVAKIVKSPKKKGQNQIIYLDTSEEAKGVREMSFPKGFKLEALPNMDGRDIIYIAGPSGSGKSTIASKMAKHLKKLWGKKAPIYIISRTEAKNDPAWKGLNPFQISADMSLVDNPIDIETEIEENSLVIFDDTNTINQKPIRDAVKHLAEDIMEVGRKMKIWMIMTSHLINPNDRSFGRTIMNELHSLTIFPKSGSTRQIKYALENYFGMDKEAVAELLKLPSRWVTISKLYPQYVVHERGIYIP